MSEQESILPDEYEVDGITIIKTKVKDKSGKIIIKYCAIKGADVAVNFPSEDSAISYINKKIANKIKR